MKAREYFDRGKFRDFIFEEEKESIEEYFDTPLNYLSLEQELLWLKCELSPYDLICYLGEYLLQHTEIHNTVVEMFAEDRK